MSNEIIKTFDYIGEKMGIMIDWSKKDLIPYLEDLWNRWITYEIVVDSIWMLVSFVIVISPWIVYRFYYKKAWKDKKSNLFYSYYP